MLYCHKRKANWPRQILPPFRFFCFTSQFRIKLIPGWRYGDSKADDLQKRPYSKRALMKESCLNTTTIFKVLHGLPENLTSQAFHQAQRFPVTNCGWHTFEATKQQVRDAQIGLHNCNTFRNITLTPINSFILWPSVTIPSTIPTVLTRRVDRLGENLNLSSVHILLFVLAFEHIFPKLVWCIFSIFHFFFQLVDLGFSCTSLPLFQP